MQVLKFHRFLMAFLMIGMISLFVSSCGDDEVTGCTDPAADNYNPEATVSSNDCTYSGCTDPDAENYDPQATNDDGSCVYARDKFIGDYVGAFLCPGTLAFISSDMLEFSIQPGLDASKKDELIVTLKNVAGGLTIDLTATADGDVLIIDAELLGVPVMGIPGDVIGTGTATLNTDQTIISAELELTVKVALIGLNQTQTCTLMGTKQ